MKSNLNLLGEIVYFKWRDSFMGDFEEKLEDLDDDQIWSAVGEVIRTSDLYITITICRQLIPEHKTIVQHPLSIPWTQILNGSLKVLHHA